VLAAHLHHGRPEQAHAELKHTERQQLHLALPCDACDAAKTGVRPKRQ
jgi:hypothetical protein